MLYQLAAVSEFASLLKQGLGQNEAQATESMKSFQLTISTVTTSRFPKLFEALFSSEN